jgi:hypothetical protein
VQEDGPADAAVGGCLLILRHSGADDQVEAPGDGLDHRGDILGVVLAVGIKQDQDVGVAVPGLGQNGLEGRALAPVVVVADDPGAGQFGHPGGVVRAAIVDHQDLVDIPPGLLDHGGDVAGLVVGGHRRQNAPSGLLSH